MANVQARLAVVTHQVRSATSTRWYSPAMASTRSAASGTDPVLKTRSMSWQKAASRTAPRAALADFRLWLAVRSADRSPTLAALRSLFKTPGVPSR